jgi:transporter family protein
MRTAIAIAIVVLAGSAGDLFLTKGMKRAGEISTVSPRSLALIGKKVLTNKFFLVGGVFMAVSFFAFLAALSWADLSLIIPATSISFVVTTVGAKLILKERISRLRWTGALLVSLGVALISLP